MSRLGSQKGVETVKKCGFFFGRTEKIPKRRPLLPSKNPKRRTDEREAAAKREGRDHAATGATSATTSASAPFFSSSTAAAGATATSVAFSPTGVAVPLDAAGDAAPLPFALVLASRAAIFFSTAAIFSLVTRACEGEGSQPSTTPRGKGKGKRTWLSVKYFFLASSASIVLGTSPTVNGLVIPRPRSPESVPNGKLSAWSAGFLALASSSAGLGFGPFLPFFPPPPMKNTSSCSPFFLSATLPAGGPLSTLRSSSSGTPATFARSYRELEGAAEPASPMRRWKKSTRVRQSSISRSKAGAWASSRRRPLTSARFSSSNACRSARWRSRRLARSSFSFWSAGEWG